MITARARFAVNTAFKITRASRIVDHTRHLSINPGIFVANACRPSLQLCCKSPSVSRRWSLHSSVRCLSSSTNSSQPGDPSSSCEERSLQPVDEFLHPHGRYLGPDPDGRVPGTVECVWHQVGMMIAATTYLLHVPPDQTSPASTSCCMPAGGVDPPLLLYSHSHSP
jgi:hypothetical protein